MDRTRRLRQARDRAKKNARMQQNAEDEAAQIDQMVEDAREKLEATKAAKLRAAESRRILDELQSELADEQADGDSDPGDGVDDHQFVSKADIGSLVADSLRSVVSYIKFYLPLKSHFI